MHSNPNWNAINNAASLAILQADRLEILLEDLGCNLKTRNQRTYRGPCPVHGGDSYSMCLEVGEDDELPIRWNCFSHQCHKDFKPSLLGLVRGVLFEQRNKKVPLREAVEYLSRYVDGGIVIHPGRRVPAKPAPEPRLLSIAPERVREQLAIPSPYFLSRGFSGAVLDRFDVGESKKLKRAVVPLYDNDGGQTCIGYLARSYRPACDQCGKHHDGPDCRYGQTRWLMSEGFPADSYLFNYAAAKASDAPVVFLVEGAPDVFRLKDIGLIGVAILGKEVSAEQLRMLAALRTMIWVAFDNDEGGTEGRMRFAKRLESSGVRLPHVDFTAPPPYKDIGDTPTVELRETILGRLKGYVELGQEMVSKGDSRGRRISQFAKHQLEDSLTRMVTAEWQTSEMAPHSSV